MARINVWFIIAAHYQTFRSSSGQRLYSDFLVFLGLPAAVWLFCVVLGFQISDAAITVLVSISAVFAALLLSVQIALFGIHTRIWSPKEGRLERSKSAEKADRRRILIRELNTNISYLLLVCCFFLCVAFILLAVRGSSVLSSAVYAAFFTHFMLTLVMCVKRGFALFDYEYVEPSN